jgi:hypothetical protein
MTMQRVKHAKFHVNVITELGYYYRCIESPDEQVLAWEPVERIALALRQIGIPFQKQLGPVLNHHTSKNNKTQL